MILRCDTKQIQIQVLNSTKQILFWLKQFYWNYLDFFTSKCLVFSIGEIGYPPKIIRNESLKLRPMLGDCDA